MKKLYFLLIIIILIACDNDNVTSNTPIFEDLDILDNSEQGIRVKEIYDKYDIYFKWDYDVLEYAWNWDGILSSKPGLPNIDYVITVIDFIEKEVFEKFPIDFIQKYFVRKVLLADTLKQSPENATPEMYYSHGAISASCLVVSHVGEVYGFDWWDKMELKLKWLSLFVEDVTTRIPYPSDFVAVSGDAYSKSSMKGEDTVKLYAILYRGRETNNRPPTVYQDFGDYVAFIIHVPEEEKQEYYEINDNVRVKAELVKEYFKENFNITLPEAK